MTKPAAGPSSVRLKGLSSFTGTEASSNEVLKSVVGHDDQENKDPTHHMLNTTADVHLLVGHSSDFMLQLQLCGLLRCAIYLHLNSVTLT